TTTKLMTCPTDITEGTSIKVSSVDEVVRTMMLSPKPNPRRVLVYVPYKSRATILETSSITTSWPSASVSSTGKAGEAESVTGSTSLSVSTRATPVADATS